MSLAQAWRLFGCHVTDESGWWRGTCDGREGWFPSNFVEPLA